MIKHFNIHVYGKVQGVFYRAHTQETAIKLNIKGLTRNEPDGSVYIEAEGEETDLKQLVDWCRQGPPRALVDKIRTEESPMKNYTQFIIER